MTKRNLSIALLALAGATLGVFLLGTPPLQAQVSTHQHSNQHTDGGVADEAKPASMDSHPEHSMNPGTSDAHPWCDNTVWSTFNHRVAGWYIALWGLTALIAGLQWPQRTWWRFAPSMVLFGLVQFLFFRNDPETWPVGPKSLWASLHGEVLQHRVFLLLLLLIAVVELLRAAGRLPLFLEKYSLPLLATLGGVYLFFHQHGGAHMPAMQHTTSNPEMQRSMASMNTVIHEHLWISVFGFGVAGGRFLGDAGILKGRWAATLWTVFAIILGAYMTRYVE